MVLNNRIRSKLKTYGELVMFSHTLFSLPFALMAMFLAADGLPSLGLILWILLALFAGRNGANALNRYVDAEFDARNPRTAQRHIPSGSVKRNEALYITIVCYILFVFAAAQINTLCLLLSPVALILFTLYSYTKRFTWLCHVILGITCAGAPVGAWLAVRGQFELVPLVFAAIVTLWVSGFDIIYGTQDIEFDRAVGLFSIPARFGYRGALWIARAFHFMMWILLIALYFITNLGIVYIVGVMLSGVLLVLEHYMVEPSHREKMNFASYHINQIISMLLLIATTVDVFIF
ncbi:UbiA-like polyprenyltransferase [Fusibacter ferrireducens]|uniref:UbiA family prenyltransferase n=1 Tax=Fusibacter ferrireducens TaxID=2785058 RepID=A0ABR9ZNB3_9FIRM|nr:UbiA-like polyprenyltransferase [Fusibacter ferrireducens]MBF4691899.1 UbiA family prenyltransferase [Fusibacter ferrireducens]